MILMKICPSLTPDLDKVASPDNNYTSPPTRLQGCRILACQQQLILAIEVAKLSIARQTLFGRQRSPLALSARGVYNAATIQPDTPRESPAPVWGASSMDAVTLRITAV